MGDVRWGRTPGKSKEIYVCRVKYRRAVWQEMCQGWGLSCYPDYITGGTPGTVGGCVG